MAFQLIIFFCPEFLLIVEKKRFKNGGDLLKISVLGYASLAIGQIATIFMLSRLSRNDVNIAKGIAKETYVEVLRDLSNPEINPEAKMYLEKVKELLEQDLNYER
nr:MAG TPA: hypothetical protein [Siphoviridae sp. ctV7v5]